MEAPVHEMEDMLQNQDNKHLGRPIRPVWSVWDSVELVKKQVFPLNLKDRVSSRSTVKS